MAGKKYNYRSTTRGGYFRKVIDGHTGGARGSLYTNTDVDAEITMGDPLDTKITSKIKADVIDGLFRGLASSLGSSPNANLSHRDKVKLINDKLASARLDASNSKKLCLEIANTLNKSMRADIDVAADPGSVCAATVRKLAEYGQSLRGETLAASEALTDMVADISNVITILDTVVIPRCSSVVKGTLSDQTQPVAEDCFYKIGKIVEILRVQFNALKALAGGEFTKHSAVILRKLDEADLEGAISEINDSITNGRRPGVGTYQVIKLIKPIAIATLISKNMLGKLDVDVAGILKRKAHGETLQAIVDGIVNAELKSGKNLDRDSRDRLNHALDLIATVYNTAPPTQIRGFSGGRDYDEREEYYESRDFSGGYSVPGRLEEQIQEKNLRTELKNQLTGTDYFEKSFRRQFIAKLAKINEAAVDAVVSVYDNTKKIDRNSEVFMQYDSAISNISNQNPSFIVKLFSGLNTHSYMLREKADYIRDLKRAAQAINRLGETLDKPAAMKRLADNIDSLAGFLNTWQESSLNKKFAKQFYYGRGEVEKLESGKRIGKETKRVVQISNKTNRSLISIKSIGDFQRLMETAIDRSEIQDSMKHTHTIESAIYERQKGLSQRYVTDFRSRLDTLNIIAGRLIDTSFDQDRKNIYDAYKAVMAANPTKSEENKKILEKMNSELNRVRITATEIQTIIKSQSDSVAKLMSLMEMANVYVMDSIKEISQISPSSTVELSGMVDSLRVPQNSRDKDMLSAKFNELGKLCAELDNFSPYFIENFDAIRRRTLEAFKLMLPLRRLLMIVDSIGPSAIKKIQTGVIMDYFADFVSKTAVYVSVFIGAQQGKKLDYTKPETPKDLEKSMKDLFKNLKPGSIAEKLAKAIGDYSRNNRLPEFLGKLNYVNIMFMSKYLGQGAILSVADANKTDENIAIIRSLDLTARALALDADNSSDRRKKDVEIFLLLAVLHKWYFEGNGSLDGDGRRELFSIGSKFVEWWGRDKPSIETISLNALETYLQKSYTAAANVGFGANNTDNFKLFKDEVINSIDTYNWKTNDKSPTNEQNISDLYVQVFDLNDISNTVYESNFKEGAVYTISDFDKTKATYTHNKSLQNVPNREIIRKLVSQPDWITTVTLFVVFKQSFSDLLRNVYSITYSCRGGDPFGSIYDNNFRTITATDAYNNKTIFGNYIMQAKLQVRKTRGNHVAKSISNMVGQVPNLGPNHLTDKGFSASLDMF